MIVFPNCKINLGLHITRKRPDGFHDLETIFYPLMVKDALEAITAGALRFNSSGITIPGEPGSNLCLQAWQLLSADFPDLPPVDIHLHKNIPIGAGLGGGSADAAFMLRLLNDKFKLELTDGQLLAYAAQLGSDCPFFVLNKPCYATGRGEILTPCPVDLSGYRLLLVHPGIHVNTGRAFGEITPKEPVRSLTDIIALPVEYWKGVLTNDFEEPVCAAHPVIADIKEKMYALGAVYASMSGSGSAVFGLFRKNEMPGLDWEKDYSVFTV